MSNNVILYFDAADLRTLVADPTVTHVRLEFPPGTDFNAAAFTDTVYGTAYCLDAQESLKASQPVKTCPRPCGD